MKKLFLFSASVLMLSIAALIGFHLGMSEASAQGGVSIVAAGNASGGHTYAVLSNGEIWAFDLNGWVGPDHVSPAPVPPAQVALLTSTYHLIDTSNNAWVFSYGSWNNLGPAPAGPTILQDTTWGAVKKENHEE